MNILCNDVHIHFLVKVTSESKIPTPGEPCNDDPNYNYYECFESYFYEARKCQYPWNTYKELNLPICTNFTETERMVFNKDRNYGYERHSFGHSERFTRTDMKCPPPCELIKYNLEYGPSLVGDFAGIMMKSIEIGFPDFMIKNKKEYRQCDSTCIIGQLGGNLGFFLGGSILAGLDLILDGIVMLYKRLFVNQKNSPAETN